MVDLVLGAGGNLKAEHGTGRAMAPYVRRQYGDELYDVMVRLKRVLDPGGILNPGVIIDDDPTAHMRNLKTPVSIEPEADRCVECGYCEPVCPSRSLTLTRASASSCAARRPPPARAATAPWPRNSRRTTTTTACRPAPSTACARRRAPCSSTRAR